MIAIDDLRVLSELVVFHEVEAKDIQEQSALSPREAAFKSEQHARYARELRRIILAQRS